MSDSSRDFLLPIVAAVVLLVVAATSVAAYVAWKRVRQSEVRVAASAPTGATPTALTVDPSDTTTSTAPTTTVTTPRLVGPHGDAVFGSTSGTGDAAQTVARLRPAFRSCYNKGLQADPTMEGRIVLTARFDASGDVTSVTKKGGSGLSTDVEQCMIRRLRNASFSPSPGGGSVDVPITLVAAK